MQDNKMSEEIVDEAVATCIKTLEENGYIAVIVAYTREIVTEDIVWRADGRTRDPGLQFFMQAVINDAHEAYGPRKQ